MSTYAQWKPEIVALLNEKNNSTLTVTDIELELLNQDDASVTVKVTPSDNSRYYSEETITYVRRDLAKAFLNIPLRVIVASDTTVGALLQKVADRFGIPFDTALDFAQTELDKAVSFEESGQQQVEIPAADSSFVWVGKITLTAANDGLDLESIIANINLTELKYVTLTEPDTTSAAFQTFPVDYTGVTGLTELAVGSTLSEEQADAIVSRTLSSEEVNSPADLKTALNGAEVQEITDGGATKVATVAVLPQPTYSGNAYITYAAQAAKTFQSVLNEYGPGRAVLVGAMGLPYDSQFPIQGIASENIACATFLDFATDSYTSLVVPAILKVVNAVGEFGLTEEQLNAVAATVTPSVTTNVPLGRNVRTLTFTENAGRSDLNSLIINFDRELTLNGETGNVTGQKLTINDPGVDSQGNSASYITGQILKAAVTSADAVAQSNAVFGAMSSAAAGLSYVMGATVDFGTWTKLYEHDDAFPTQSVPDKYQRRTGVYLKPDGKAIAFSMRAVNYASDFEYRLADEYLVVFNLADTVPHGTYRWNGDGATTSLVDGLVFNPDNPTQGQSYGSTSSLVAVTAIATLLGVTAGTPDANKQVRLTVTGTPLVLEHTDNSLPVISTMLQTQYGGYDKFLATIFDDSGDTSSGRQNAVLFSLYDRYLQSNTSPTADVTSGDYIWSKLNTPDGLNLDEDFVATPVMTATIDGQNINVRLEFTARDSALLGIESSSVDLGYSKAMFLTTTNDLMGFQGLTVGSAGDTVNLDYTGTSPVLLLGSLLANIRDGVVPANGFFDTIVNAVEERYSAAALYTDTGWSGDVADYTQSNVVDVIDALPNNELNWKKYIAKVEMSTWTYDRAVVVCFKPVIADGVERLAVSGVHEQGGMWTLVNLYPNQLIGYETLEINATTQSVVDKGLTAAQAAHVAGVILDNVNLIVTPAQAGWSTVENPSKLPGQGTDWKVSGKTAA